MYNYTSINIKQKNVIR